MTSQVLFPIILSTRAKPDLESVAPHSRAAPRMAVVCATVGPWCGRHGSGQELTSGSMVRVIQSGFLRRCHVLPQPLLCGQSSEIVSVLGFHGFFKKLASSVEYTGYFLQT